MAPLSGDTPLEPRVPLPQWPARHWDPGHGELHAPFKYKVAFENQRAQGGGAEPRAVSGFLAHPGPACPGLLVTPTEPVWEVGEGTI